MGGALGGDGGEGGGGDGGGGEGTDMLLLSATTAASDPVALPRQRFGAASDRTKHQTLPSRRKLVRFIFEEMKGELLLCDEAWELENGPGNHLLLIDRCLKNQVPQAQQGSRRVKRPVPPSPMIG